MGASVKIEDYIGKKIGRLTILEQAESKNSRRQVRCLCECGKIKEICLMSIRNGDVKSCGCYSKENASLRGRLRKKPNKHIVEGNVVKIFDNKGNIALVDLEDYSKIADDYYCQDHRGYWRSVSTDANKSLHRIIMDCPKGLVVDHINHKKYDCRKANLRICTQESNVKNNCNSIGFTKTRSGRYQPYINVNKKMVWLGAVDTVEEALLIRREAEKKYYGEFARSDEEFLRIKTKLIEKSA